MGGVDEGNLQAMDIHNMIMENFPKYTYGTYILTSSHYGVNVVLLKI